jgi:hypothetical protein
MLEDCAKTAVLRPAMIKAAAMVLNFTLVTPLFEPKLIFQNMCDMDE